MAHLEKFNIQKYDWVLGHCNRTLTGEHESHSVDKSLSHLNRNYFNKAIVKNEIDNAKKYIDGKITEIGLRKNGVCLASWVVQPPDEVKKEDYEKFFKSVSVFMINKYGNNWIRSDVHFDETTNGAKPHSHNLIIPLKDGKFRAKEIFTKKDLLTFHKELSDWVSSSKYGLGYPISMLNGATVRDAKGKAIKVSKYNALKYEKEVLEYMVKESKLDSPSSTRYHMLELKNNDGEISFTLNLQVRYK